MMKELVEKELRCRDNGKTGALGNLSYLQVLCLAYKLKIIR